jgi:hypothetical protein
MKSNVCKSKDTINMTQALNIRAICILHFMADMKATSYTHIGQFIAPNCEPAIDEPQLDKKNRRGGNQRHAPWPLDRQKRIKAVSQLIDRWEDVGLVQSERPWLDRPKWAWVTMAGLRRLGLPYNDARFYDDEEELNHLYQITRVRLLVAHHPGVPETAWFEHTWVSERAIKAGYPQNTPGIDLPHLPDGAMELEKDSFVKMAEGVLVPLQRGDRIAVEIERSRKDFPRLDLILPDLLKHYVGVWYFCRPKAADAVLKTKERLLKEGNLTSAQARLIRVLDLAEEEG